ncbi:hypothetical protein [Dictyobacter arantiisoli]|uniref:Uncharacterized protein n=1 Tax=Dictyobacter arantiisoli TaxID=2014874 RepID=A0A5A5TB98_9CHLR|nr:hypothetical protein [Dictyobacter arantiisoli]GCF08515.1 hypothetical protein KDI_20790 [Dictyobacter arantiisoli]
MEHLDTFLTVLYVMVDDLCKQHSLSIQALFPATQYASDWLAHGMRNEIP